MTVSAKVRRELLHDAKRLNINISEVIRRALEKEVQRRRLSRLEEELRSNRDILDKLDINEIVEAIREDREAR